MRAIPAEHLFAGRLAPTGRLAVYTTIHPGCAPFLASWCESMRAQQDRDFDLWIGLDVAHAASHAPHGAGSGAIAPASIEAAVQTRRPVRWVISRPGDTPAALRQRAFAELVRQCDQIVFVDADDRLEPDRISAAREGLTRYDVVACALRLIEADGRDLAISLAPEPETDLRALLPRYNVFGLSNSAWRGSVLARCLPLPPDCELIDWLLVSRASAAGARLGFDPIPRMAYRQHGANCAAVRPPFTPEAVMAASVRVLHHYDLLLDGARGNGHWSWPDHFARRPFDAARVRAAAFDAAMRASPAALARYTSALNVLPPRYVWWWAVAHPDLEALWLASPCTGVRSARALRPS